MRVFYLTTYNILSAKKAPPHRSDPHMMSFFMENIKYLDYGACVTTNHHNSQTYTSHTVHKQCK